MIRDLFHTRNGWFFLAMPVMIACAGALGGWFE